MRTYFTKFQISNWLNFWIRSSAKVSEAFFMVFRLDSKAAKVCTSCRSRQELSNEYLFAKIGVDTAENGPLKVWKECNSLFIRLLTPVSMKNESVLPKKKEHLSRTNWKLVSRPALEVPLRICRWYSGAQWRIVWTWRSAPTSCRSPSRHHKIFSGFSAIFALAYLM